MVSRHREEKQIRVSAQQAHSGEKQVDHRRVLGMRVDASSYDGVARRIARWTEERRSSYVCVANVHMTMETVDSSGYREIVNGADLIVPDGRPLVWALKGLGVAAASQVRGAYLVGRVSELAAVEGIPIGLYGSKPEVLEDLARRLRERYPGIQIACKIAPPFRPLTAQEDHELTQQISLSGARILFVGLGCPKQEHWMAEHKGRIPVTMLGVGAAFDFLSGRTRQAPRWLQSVGLEWVHRLASDPRRLWARYAKHNPRFLGLFALQLAGLMHFDKEDSFR